MKVALMHLAFWGRFVAPMLEEWERAGARRGANDDEHSNHAGLHDRLAAPAECALREVLEAATPADRRAARVGEQLRAAMVAANEARACLRHKHRTEHLAQMERGAFLYMP